MENSVYPDLIRVRTVGYTCLFAYSGVHYEYSIILNNTFESCSFLSRCVTSDYYFLLFVKFRIMTMIDASIRRR